MFSSNFSDGKKAHSYKLIMFYVRANLQRVCGMNQVNAITDDE
jgi:hypothetical protein